MAKKKQNTESYEYDQFMDDLKNEQEKLKSSLLKLFRWLGRLTKIEKEIFLDGWMYGYRAGLYKGLKTMVEVLSDVPEKEEKRKPRRKNKKRRKTK